MTTALSYPTEFDKMSISLLAKLWEVLAFSKLILILMHSRGNDITESLIFRSA